MAKVIFDTNAYRNLVTGKEIHEIEAVVADIKVKEAKHGITTLLSPIVAQELLAHLANKNDSAFHKCLKANKALYLHNGTPEQCNVFPVFETLLAKMYFGAVPEKRVETYNAIIQMSYHLAINPSDANFSIFDTKLQTVKATVEQGEQGFIDGMFTFVKQADPTATDWRPFRTDRKKRRKLLEGLRSEASTLGIAKGYLFMTHLKLGESGHHYDLKPEGIDHLTRSVAANFPEPIALFKNVIENIVNSEFPLDEESRGNFVWDIALMFSAGKNKILNDKLYFVTADKAIIRTAVKEGSGCYVLTLDEYLEYLDTEP